MGFWDFLIKSKEKKETEKVKAEGLETWLSDKKNEIEKQEDNFLKLIQERINHLIQEFEVELSALKKINIDEKKAEEKIKLIVRENLENYIVYLEKLIEKLKEMKAEKNIIEKINSIFSDFDKRASISFEKSTFLIGKEMANVKDSIRNFFRDLEKLLKENKELIDISRIISLVEMKIKKIAEIEKIKSETEKTIEECDNKINNLKEGIKIKEKEIEKIKKSEKFIEEGKKKEELVMKKEELEKEIYKLREMIDFKSLANFFHSFQKEMNIIKAYKENFKNAFQMAEGEDILSLVKEAKLQTADIQKKFEEINEKKKEINSIIIEKTEIENIEDEIKKTEAEIKTLNLKKFPEEKKCKRLELNSQEIISLIKDDLSKINVEVSNV